MPITHVLSDFIAFTALPYQETIDPMLFIDKKGFLNGK